MDDTTFTLEPPSEAHDPFTTPSHSRSTSFHNSSSSFSSSIPNQIQLPRSSRFSRPPTIISQRPITTIGTPKNGGALPRMPSHMLTSPASKPWTTSPKPRAIIAYLLTYSFVLIGFAIGILQCYLTFVRVPIDHQPLCLVMDEQFLSEDSVFGPSGNWQREVNMDGYGNGEFSMTTASQNNSYIFNNQLYIVPTLTSDSIGEAAVLDGTVYNITGCTFNSTQPNNGFITDWQTGEQVFDVASYTRACSAVSNATLGSVINPVQSARLTTRGKKSIRFGRVEIKAKMPNGDWMWPALWMLPTTNVYGPWPLSGEIDLVESRGNGIRYTARGSNYVQGSLNWGPSPALNAVSKTYSWWSDKRTPFSNDFHTYVLEWTDKFLRISVDTRLHTLLDLKFDKPFWERGDFPQVVVGSSGGLEALQNPWVNGTNVTPFDQEFYLIMNVAVGSTTGWFPESQGNKPWLDHAPNPMRDFANAEQTQWYPTWPSQADKRAMIVDYVKMWKHC